MVGGGGSYTSVTEEGIDTSVENLTCLGCTSAEGDAGQFRGNSGRQWHVEVAHQWVFRICLLRSRERGCNKGTSHL